MTGLAARAFHATPAVDSPARIAIREATTEDNDALLALTEATPMAGTISLRIDRRPDFFALLAARGEPTVFVATCGPDIIGCASATTYTAYVRGVPEAISHIGDLKVHPRFTGQRLALRLVAALEAHLRSKRIDVGILLIAEGNERASSVAAGKHGTPRTECLGRFVVSQILPAPFTTSSGRFRVEDAGAEHLPEVVALLDAHSRERLFGPVITVADIERKVREAGPGAFSRMMIAHDSGRVVATLTIEDTQRMRQNVVIALPWSLRLALALLRVVAMPVPGLRVPAIGRPIAMLHTRHMACLPGHEPALRQLIAEARVEAFRRRVTFLSVGLDERDALRAAVAGFPCLTFRSHAMVACLAAPDRVKTLGGSVLFEDFALV